MTAPTHQWRTETISEGVEPVEILSPRKPSAPHAGVAKTILVERRGARGIDMRNIVLLSPSTEYFEGFRSLGVPQAGDDVAADATFHEHTWALPTAAKHQSVGTIPRPSDQGALLACIAERMNELQEAADEDGVSVSQASIDGLHGFVERSGATRMPLLTLRPEGNLRALWDRPSGEQIGLQFLDRFRIGYVLFARALDGTVDHHFGTVSRSRLLPLIRHFRLSALLVD